MKRSLAMVLQLFIVLVGIGTLALLLLEPHLEGRNKEATLFEIYFKDFFLAYVYLGFVPFFVGLYQVFWVLGYVGNNSFSSKAVVQSLRAIKYCAVVFLGVFAASALFLFSSDPEDRPAGVFMRLLLIVPSIVVAIGAAWMERVVENTVDGKSGSSVTA